MSIPDFERAEYTQPQVLEGEIVGGPVQDARFGLALIYGAAAALIGSLGYALVGLSGFMISIVAIGMAWLIAKAMMTASGGVGGRKYQIAAVVLTYFSVTLGEVLHPLWLVHAEGVPLAAMLTPRLLKYLLFGPFLGLQHSLNGILGLLILGIGMRYAWQMARGGAGFGRPMPGTYRVR